MNLLLIFVLITLLLCVWRGYQRGLLQSILVAGAIFVSMVLSAKATPYVVDCLTEHTSVEAHMTEKIKEKLPRAAMETETRNDEIRTIEELPYPILLKNALIENNNAERYVEMKVDAFYTYLATYIAGLLIRILAYLIVQVSLMVFLLVLIYTTKVLTDLPVIHGLDKTGGVILGLAQWLAITWSVMILISLLGNTEFGTLCFGQITENPVLSFLYDHNVFMMLLT